MSTNSLRDAAIVTLKHYGFGPAKIAQVLELQKGVVSGVLYRAGLTESSNSAEPVKRSRGRPPIDQTIREAAVAYAWKHSDAAAAAKFGVSRASVFGWRTAA